MKKILFVASIAMLGISSGHATDGTLTFTGKITDSTCKISNPGPSFTITLPTVSTTTLSATGNVAGRTPFQLTLTECSVTNVTAYFEPGSTVNASNWRLNNQVATGAAQNVQIQILNSAGTLIQIKAGGTDGSQSGSEWVNVTTLSGSANLIFAAEYYATGATTAGLVSTSVQYTLIYK